MVHPDRYFDPDPTIRKLASELYSSVAGLPLVCPHGHVDPALLAGNDPFPDPAQLIIIPDHYIFRMLYSQGVQLESLGIAPQEGGACEEDSRKIWQTFADHYHLFRATPTAGWLRHEFESVFGIEESLCSANAMELYDQIAAKLLTPEFLPRALFESFNIEVLCTTDAATDDLASHRQLLESDWEGTVRPTFRPDAAVNLLAPGWKDELDRLAACSGEDVSSFAGYIRALEARREFFKSLGATATDHGVFSPYSRELSAAEADAIFQRALAGEAGEDDEKQFIGHMLMEFARMSVEDGLVMQLHPGSWRNHNTPLFEAFGADMGCDIPVATDYTRNLQPLLARYGSRENFTLVLFTLDESTFSRELAPLAGHYPCLRLGPPWWFQDSREGMTRFRERVTETCGIYNTAGFNDDTRAFPSIPARHDVARRIDANFLARLVAEHVLEEGEAAEMIVDLAYSLAKKTYRL
jgi:glucuronate isomerase